MATTRDRHPEIFQPTGTESPRGKQRSVPMECMNLSFMRCGTSSMHVALQVLGMKCWHSTLFMSANAGDIEMWEEVLNRKFFAAGESVTRKDFDQLFHDFGAISSDIPALAFSEELIKAYPESKIVLVERDIEGWYKSFESSIIDIMVGSLTSSLEKIFSCTLLNFRTVRFSRYITPGRYAYTDRYFRFSPIVWLFYYLDPYFVRPMGHCQHKCIQGWLGAYSAKDLRQNARSAYRNHYELVRRLVPQERLLEFKLEDGWEPLCKFLEKPVPDQPFPHINDQQWLQEKINLLLRKAMRSIAWRAAKAALPVGGAIGIGYYYYFHH